MKHKYSKEEIMSYLYDEMDKKERGAFEKYLNQSPELQKELAELKGMSVFLQKWEITDPKMNLVFVKDKVSIAEKIKNMFRIPNLSGGKLAVAGALAILFIISILNINIQYSDHRLKMSIGIFNDDNIDYATLEKLLNEKQAETLNMTARLIKESENSTKEDIQRYIDNVFIQIESQRQRDLRMVERAFLNYDDYTTTRLYQTNRTLENFINTVSRPLQLENIQK